MKAMFLLLLMGFMSSATAADNLLRQYGTNVVVDFSQAAGLTNFNLFGKVSKVVGSSLILARDTDRARYYLNTVPEDAHAGTRANLALVSAQRLAATNGITLAHYLTLSPEVQFYFTPRRETELVFVKNGVKGLVGVAALSKPRVQLPYCVPVAAVSWAGTTLPAYEYGLPAPERGTNWFLATAAGLVRPPVSP